jgi:uncharacterized protein YlxP (DUF503 family)
MTVGVLTFELHLPEAHSLKDKRQVVRSVKERVRARHNVAVSELEEHADLWQRASIAIVSIAGHRDVLDALFEKIVRETESHIPGHLVETGRDFLDGGLA